MASDNYKIYGALLGTLLVVLVLGTVSDAIFSAAIDGTPGDPIEVAEAAPAGAVAAEAPAEEPIAVLLASASVDDGIKVAKKCAACHSFENGGANKVGPNLWDIVNRQAGTVAGFNYSGALAEFGAANTWTYDHLDGFLAKPKDYVSGTSMAFAGLRKPQDRADIIAYLRSLSDNPAPLETE